MKKILIFAGTTEGRLLSETLAAAGIAHIVSVATEYGEMVMKEHPLVEVKCGRMNKEEMAAFMEKEEFSIVVDATHPYAQIVTENIKAAAQSENITYLRLNREENEDREESEIRYFGSHGSCADALKELEGNILLTTGSKDLNSYCDREGLKERLYVRILPGIQSLEFCMKNGICGKQILALQGPFSVEMNDAMIRQFGIQCLVTKKSGKNSGYEEKLMAAERTGIPVFVVDRQISDCEGMESRQSSENKYILG
ncbi:MAG: precorrin-6A reductase, partial [Lachnospiraceae bacterium]|nr:precorrin-6A reductase [Lachnospiraceae bacterium]